MAYCFRGCPPPPTLPLFLRSGRCPSLTGGSQNPPLSYNEATGTGALTRSLPVTGVWTRWTELYFTSCCHLKSRVLRLPLATCPSKGEAIRHFHISHNAPYLPPLFCITFVFHFSCVLKPSQEKLKTMLTQFFFLGGGEGGNKVH